MSSLKITDGFADKKQMNGLVITDDFADKKRIKCLVIADDFTGANDTGMQLARRGYSTEVLLRIPEVICAGENNSEVINAEAAWEL